MYNSKDFDNCFFNPLEKELLKKYPELGDVSTDERLLRYIISLYDHNSLLVRKYRDPQMRKQEGARLAGYDLKKDDDYLECLYAFKDEVARRSVVKFLRTFMYPREWFMICANEQTLYEYGERMMKPIDDTGEGAKEKDLISAIAIKSKLSEDMEAINKRIEAGYRKLFGDDEALLNVKGATTAERMATSV